VNPELGTGSIKELSTSIPWSKFGVGIDQYRTELLAAYEEKSYLRMIHCHVGSQGVDFALMTSGVRKLVDFAIELEAAGSNIESIDIGGGLTVNFASDELTPTFEEYAKELRVVVPELFDGRFELITEFGRSLSAKSGFVIARVEYTKESGGRKVAIVQTGADLFVRTVYNPDKWPLRVSVFDGLGQPKTSPLEPWDVAGPCCFSGDVIAHQRPLPALEQGDLLLVHDTGGYYFSAWSYYNSRQAPPVYLVSGNDNLEFELIRAASSVDETLCFFKEPSIDQKQTIICSLSTK